MQYDVTIQQVAWFNSRRQDGSLIISPKWQRRAVWLEKERTSLIETIFLKLPFPEVYVQTITNPADGSQKYVVVDGQQRITSILKFADGEVQLPNVPPWDGKVFDDLSDPEKQSFWGYKIVVRQINTESDAEIRDLFTRLNTNSIALNDQELRNARFVGKFKESAERLADNPFFQSIRLFTAREIRRMEDVEFVSELLVRVAEGLSNKKDLVDVLYATYEEDFPRAAEFEEDFNAAMQLLMTLVSPENATLIKTKSNFYSLFGACLEYWRTNRRQQYNSVQQAQTEITDLLRQAREFDAQNPGNTPPNVREYYDAVSRASSDKQRRVTRERLLLAILATK